MYSSLLPVRSSVVQCGYLAFVNIFVAARVPMSDKQNLKRNVSPEAALVCCEWRATQVHGRQNKMLPLEPFMASLGCGAFQALLLREVCTPTRLTSDWYLALDYIEKDWSRPRSRQQVAVPPLRIQTRPPRSSSPGPSSDSHPSQYPN